MYQNFIIHSRSLQVDLITKSFIYQLRHKHQMQFYILRSVNVLELVLFTQPLRSGRIWHKVNF